MIKGKFANSLSLGLIDLDIITILTGYLFLAYGSTCTVLFAFSQGFAIDTYSGGPQGIFSLTYFSIFLLFLVGSRSFNISDPKGQFFLVFIAVGFKKIVTILIFWASSNYATLSPHIIWFSGLSTVVTALAAPIVFFMFNRAREMLGLKEEP